MSKLKEKMLNLKEKSPFLFASLVIIVLAIIFFSVERVGESIGSLIYQISN